MNDKLRRKKQISKKSIIFWSFMALLLVVLLTLLGVRLGQTREISSYKKLDMITGEELFVQDDDKYFVLFYGFEGSKEYESFDNGMYKYLTFCRDNLKHTKIFGMDANKPNNRKCFSDQEKIDGATEFPNALNASSSTVLKVLESELPILFVIEEGSVTTHYSGENAILSYLRDVMVTK